MLEKFSLMLVKTPQNFLWIPEKLAKNGDFRKILGPIWDFSTKEGFKIRDPQISWYPLGTTQYAEARCYPKKKVPTFWLQIQKI